MSNTRLKKKGPNPPPLSNIWPFFATHNVLGPKADYSLIVWAESYIKTEVEEVLSANTLEAKKRDLGAFMRWFAEANGTLALDQWVPRDTHSFMEHLEELGRAPSSINRAFATLRTFGRWLVEQDALNTSPTKGIKELETEEPEAKKLSKNEIKQLFRAADRLTEMETKASQMPRRNRAVLALLYYTGLRVSELCSLQRNQYNGTHLLRVRRKGKRRSPKLYVAKECRRYLDDYIETERGRSRWLFVSRYKTQITRRSVYDILVHIAQEASKHLKKPIEIHPHRLRHTFGFEIWERTRSEIETQTLLGHKTTKYLGRYVKYTSEEREQIIDSL